MAQKPIWPTCAPANSANHRLAPISFDVLNEDDCDERAFTLAPQKNEREKEKDHRHKSSSNRQDARKSKEGKKVMQRFRGRCCLFRCIRCRRQLRRLPSNVNAATVSMHLTSLVVCIINNNHHPHHHNHRQHHQAMAYV